jgi:exonuclease III
MIRIFCRIASTGTALFFCSRIIKAHVVPIATGSRRVCDALFTCDSAKLMLINVYMPCEADDEEANDVFMLQLSVINDVIRRCADCLVVCSGDFNVDFNRISLHTKFLTDFCERSSLVPVLNHASSEVD